MSDFKNMLFSETIKPLNWQELQAKDEAMQKEIDDQLAYELESKKISEELDDDYQDTGMSRSDFYSGGTF